MQRRAGGSGAPLGSLLGLAERVLGSELLVRLLETQHPFTSLRYLVTR
jgi:hypothetical protein